MRDNDKRKKIMLIGIITGVMFAAIIVSAIILFRDDTKEGIHDGGTFTEKITESTTEKKAEVKTTTKATTEKATKATTTKDKKTTATTTETSTKKDGKKPGSPATTEAKTPGREDGKVTTSQLPPRGQRLRRQLRDLPQLLQPRDLQLKNQSRSQRPLSMSIPGKMCMRLRRRKFAYLRLGMRMYTRIEIFAHTVEKTSHTMKTISLDVVENTTMRISAKRSTKVQAQ